MPELAKRESSIDQLAADARVIPAAMLTKVPEATKLAFRGRSSAIEAAGRAFGTSLPQIACRFATKGTRTAYWLGPDEWLLQDEEADPKALHAEISKALDGHSHSLVDVSHRSETFALFGARAAYILNHGCPLDLSLQAFPVGMCTRTILNKATIMLSRPEADVFHIDVWRSFAPYVWQLLDEARSELR